MVATAIILARALHNLASPGGVPVVPLKVRRGTLADLDLDLYLPH